MSTTVLWLLLFAGPICVLIAARVAVVLVTRYTNRKIAGILTEAGYDPTDPRYQPCYLRE